MKTTKYALAAVFGLIALVAPRALQASTIVFTASGTFTDGSAITGTLTIDNARGVVTAVNINVAAVATAFTDLTDQFTNGSIPNYYLFESLTPQPAQPPNPQDELQLYFPVANLVGYTGGPLCSLSGNCPTQGGGASVSNYSSNTVYLQIGSLTAPSTVPEPSSLLLLGTGLVGLMGKTFRRKPNA